MTELIQESTLAEYEAFVQSHPKGHFAQSSLWAKQKPAWKWRAIVSRGADGRIRGSIAFLHPHHALYPQNDALRLPRPRLRS